ncbi:MAG TPA: potassium channel family protein [Pontiella sp.]|nr:potassium channel family protein [Pontiella sp.]
MFLKSLAEKIGQYTLVLIMMLTAMILLPIFGNNLIGRMLLNFWSLLTLVLLVLSLSQHRKQYLGIIVLGGALFAGFFIYSIGQVFMGREFTEVGLTTLALAVVFFNYCIWTILYSIFQHKLFTRDLISGAILAYVLLGIAWGGLNALIEHLAPGSYSFPQDMDQDHKASALIYHSFITLTTLGYGDILPLTRITRSSAYLEAVTGVMYTAILIAGLVGNMEKENKQQ